MDVKSEIEIMSKAVYILCAVFFDEMQCKVDLDREKCLSHLKKCMRENFNDRMLDIYSIYLTFAKENIANSKNGINPIGNFFIGKMFETEKISKRCIVYLLHLRSQNKFRNDRPDDISIKKTMHKIRDELVFAEDVMVIYDDVYCVEKVWIKYDIWDPCNKREMFILK